MNLKAPYPTCKTRLFCLVKPIYRSKNFFFAENHLHATTGPFIIVLTCKKLPKPDGFLLFLGRKAPLFGLNSAIHTHHEKYKEIAAFTGECPAAYT
ncbi:MAG TPA: hypothetical protein VK668_04215 [Mucilaginibacter sp.]|nr:hypothetical protein [Mucilaginibacter sp.]